MSCFPIFNGLPDGRLMAVLFYHQKCNRPHFQRRRPISIPRLKFERPFSMFVNVLSVMKCSSELNKRKSVDAKLVEFGGCEKTCHRNDLIFSSFCLAAIVKNESDYIFIQISYCPSRLGL